MTYIKTYVPDYEELLKWNANEIVERFRKYDTLIGDSKSIDYINEVLKKYYEKNKISN